MFGLLTRSGNKVSSPRTRSARLGLERLESRDTPSTLTISVSYGIGSNVTLSGDLTNTSAPANQVIMLTGEVGGMAFTDANGHYSATFPASALGEVDAQTMDGSSNVATVTLTDTAPQVFNFGGIQESATLWDFRGTVTWSHPFLVMPGQIQGPAAFGTVPVSFRSDGTMTNGLCTGTADVMFEFNKSSDVDGNYIASATDFWGTNSNGAVNCIWD